MRKKNNEEKKKWQKYQLSYMESDKFTCFTYWFRIGFSIASLIFNWNPEAAVSRIVKHSVKQDSPHSFNPANNNPTHPWSE